MRRFAVKPVHGFQDILLEEVRELPLDCAHGIVKMFDHLEDNDPALRDRCGRIADRFELFAIPVPDCAARKAIVTIDDRDKSRPRAVHGSVLANPFACKTGLQMASRQLGLVNPSWEPAQ